MGDKNGGNLRLDRVERMVEGLGKAHAQHNSELAEHRAQFKREMAKHRAETNRDMRLIRVELRRWAALRVQEARSHRTRQREIDLNITRLSAAQLVTEERLRWMKVRMTTAGTEWSRRYSCIHPPGWITVIK